MHPGYEGRRYIVTSSLIDWAHTQNDPCYHDDEIPRESTLYFRRTRLTKGQ